MYLPPPSETRQVTQTSRGSSYASRALRYVAQRAGGEYRGLVAALAARLRDSVGLPAGSSLLAPVAPAGGRHVILFLAANPSETTRLALDEECAAIERELRMTTGRDDFDFRSKWAVSIDDMMRHLNELQPTIIHFSGHGGGSTGIYLQDEQRQRAPETRHVKAASDAGIYLEDEHHRPQHVSARALTQMIGSAAPSTRIVVLNACYSDVAAEALRGVVDCVVGMRGAIGDDAARSFAVGFYRALGHRRSVGNAVDQAVATLTAKRFPDAYLPVCRTRDGVRASQVTLPQLDPPLP
jgi:CHAT domain